MSKESDKRNTSRRNKPGIFVKRSPDLGNILRGVPERFVQIKIVTYRERPIGDDPLFIGWICSACNWRLSPSVASHNAHVAFSKHVHSTHNVLADEYQHLGKAWEVTVPRKAIPKESGIIK